jgi:hypothetical protein
MNKELVARKLRECLESRIAGLLDCQPSDLALLKLGTLVHFLFMLKGNSEEVGGFSTTIRGVLDLLGNEVVWKVPEEGQPAEEPEKVVVN